jgi:hypothetical protein
VEGVSGFPRRGSRLNEIATRRDELQPRFSEPKAVGISLAPSDCIGQSLETKEQAMKARFITTFFSLMALTAAVIPIAQGAAIGRF